MAKQFPGLTDDHRSFIAQQPVYFVATAATEGRVNLSPKGMDSLRVTGPTQLVWLNVTGSGNETAAHLAQNPRMTVMWCSFALRPVILRCYGTARTLHLNHAEWPQFSALLPAIPGARQIFVLDIDLVQSSCGYAVPLMEDARERPTLRTWATDKGDALPDYWSDRNRQSIDGLDTGIEANL